MEFRAKVKYFGAVPMGSLTAQDMRLLIRDAWVEVGLNWHRYLRPKHFTPAGAREYGYARRKPGYLRQKRRKVGHSMPLMWSGNLEEGSRLRRIEAKAFRQRSGVRVFLPGAQGANWRHPASDVDMREELTRVSQRDAERMVDRHNRTMNERLRSFGRSLTKQL